MGRFHHLEHCIGETAIAQRQRLHGGGGSFDQLHAIDYLVYAYLQQAKDASAQEVLAEMAAMTRVDEDQFAAAYALAASPARVEVETKSFRQSSLSPIRFRFGQLITVRNKQGLDFLASGIGPPDVLQNLLASRSLRPFLYDLRMHPQR